MSARRIARELAVIVFPQLPRDKSKLERMDFELLLGKAVWMLCDYAKQNLAEANALMLKAQSELLEIESEHEDNAALVADLKPVNVSTGQLRVQLDMIERALQLVSEALDVPEMALYGGSDVEVSCPSCGAASSVTLKGPSAAEAKDFLLSLLNTYLTHKRDIDQFIQKAKSKWRVERMISIDRDILRLACTEAFFMREVPLRVSISEAVELTHRFADERAAKFINGILGDLAKEAEHFRRTGKFQTQTEEGDNNGSHLATGGLMQQS